MTIRGDPKIFYLLIRCSLPRFYHKKIFLASMEATEASEATEAENFPKNKYGSKCLELPNSARNLHYKNSKASWP